MRAGGGCGSAVLWGALMMTTALTGVMPLGGAVAEDARGRSHGVRQGEAVRPLAQAAPAERSFDIPAQSLTDALTLFGRQSGMQVSVDAGLIRGIASPGVRGSMPPEHALRQLLAGTGIGYRLTGGDTAMLERLPSGGSGVMQLDPVMVEGQSVAHRLAEIGNLPPEYAGGQVARGGRVGLLGNRDMMDTPFSTSSYTAGLVEDRQAVTVADVVDHDPSVRSSASKGGILDAFFIRGFPIGEGNLGEIA